MKKIILSLFVIALSIMPSMGQNAFNKGDKVINLAIGVGNRLYSSSSYSDITPAISGSYEMCVKDDLFDANSSLGIGAYVGYTGAKYNYSSSAGYKYKDLIVGARGALHYQLIDKLDTYAGLMLGYDIVNAESFGPVNRPPKPDPYIPGSKTHEGVLKSYTLAAQTVLSNASSSGFEFALYVGGRYYFTHQLAALLELGYGIAYVNIGVAIKL